jgi:hypothetical protein
MLRRFLVLAALMFWQGGFVFYAAVVVPSAMSVLRPPSLQSFVTLKVTHYLNLAGVVTLAALALDVYLSRDPSPRRRWFRAGCVAFMALASAALFVLRGRLAEWMDTTSQTILDREALYPLHRGYLWISTAQWLAAVAFIVLMLIAWREEDRGGK